MAVGNPISLTDNVASRIISQIATESQTDFTISGGYRLNAISVYRNGVRLVSGRDYSAADGSTVVLLSGASLSDVLEFHIFDDFRVADALVSNASHQNIEGNLTIAGILTVTTLDLSSLTVSDSISIGGTLTYEDVTNVDSIGIITARTDLHVGAGLSVVGVSTFSGNVDLGSDASTDTITATGRFDSNLIPSSDDAKDIGSSSLEWRDLYIDGTGNIDSLVSGDGTFSTSLGIGTANPSNYGSDIKLALSSSGDTNLSIGAGVGKTSNVFFADGTSGDDRYRGSIRYAHDNDSMRFHTAAAEKLRITSDGSVGIGTNNPQRKLSIKDSGNTFISIENSTNVTSGLIGANSSGLTLISRDTQGGSTEKPIQFITGSTEKVRIDSDGNVGVGTNNPETKLHVSDGHTASANDFDSNIVLAVTKNTTIDSFAGIAINSGNNAGSFIHFGDTDDSNVGRLDYSHSDNAFKFFTNGDSTERLGITSTGKIGINQSTPTADLEVAGTTGTASTIFINAPTHSSSVASEAVLKFGYAHSGSPNAVAEIKLVEGSTNSFGGNLTFSVPSNNSSGGSSTSEVLRITSDGKIGINTTTGFDTSVGLAVRNGNSGSDHTMIDIIANTNETSRVVFSDDADHMQGRIQYNHNGNSLGFYTNGENERIHITSGGLIGMGAANNTSYDSNAQNLLLASSGNTGMTIRSAGDTPFAMIHFADGTSNNDEKRAGRIVYQHVGDNLTLHTANTERLRISGLGTVSITGNTSNTEYLRMGGNLARGLRFTSSSGSSSVGVVHTINAPGDGGAQGEIVLATNSTERLHIQSNGQLLFKGTSGDNQFTSRRTNVAGSSGDYFFHFNAQNKTPVTVGTFGFHQDGVEDSSRFVLSTRNTGGSNTERFRITSTGNIGIGSASPVTDVDISQKTGAVALPQGTTAQRPSGSSPYIRYNTTNSALEFYNGTEWVEIITDYFPTGSTILG